MKKYICVILIGIFSLPLFAQEETLVGGNARVGWYFASTTRFTTINDEMATLDGWRAVLTLNKTWTLGMTSVELDENDVPAPITWNNQAVYMDLDYHGLEIGHIWNSDRVAHFTADLLLALGVIDYNAKGAGKRWSQDLVGVIEPTVQMEVNVVRWMRIGLGAGYRYVTAIDIEGLSSGDVSGPSGILTFKFGKF